MNYYKEKNRLGNEEFLERLELVMYRVKEIAEHPEGNDLYKEFFQFAASRIVMLERLGQQAVADELEQLDSMKLSQMNHRIYDEFEKGAYETSYANPSYAVEKLGMEYGQLFANVYSHIHRCIRTCIQGDLVSLCIYTELFVEIYVAMLDEETSYEQVKEIYHSFMHDSQEILREAALCRQFDPDYDYDYHIVMDSDLSAEKYLYFYGLYVSDNELRMSQFLNTFSEEAIQSMADTYTEGYRIGFEVCGKDLSTKKVVQVRYPIGFERMVRVAVCNFEKMGLRAICEPYSTSVNRQFDFDYRESHGLYWDKAYVERGFEVLRNGFEKLKELAPLMGGPAVIEVFGEEPFAPVFKKEAVRLDERQQQLNVYSDSESMKIYSEFMDMKNRSFTIIAYPIPAIGEAFEKIFEETVKLNTLDYNLYQRMQQKLIDVLDQADYVHILGTNGNKTDLRVKIYPLSDPATETAFENCVADVNIPVGEVFTSPVLEGTNGKLHVSQVYLNDLNYLNLELDFEDGKITTYHCTNFEEEAENLKYIEDNVLFHHETLPLGEFAIGTNTTAFVMARKYQIGDKLPILIAEKTGPHFAVGDTCYKYDEENVTYNPDGKKIVARDNSISILRKEDVSKAYFNCHTDITIPYDELGKITAVTRDGQEIDIIVNGRFVVPGTEELNQALDQEGV